MDSKEVTLDEQEAAAAQHQKRKANAAFQIVNEASTNILGKIEFKDHSVGSRSAIMGICKH